MANGRKTPIGDRFGSVAARYALGILLLVTLLLVLLNRGGGWLGAAQPQIDGVVAPVQRVLAAPFVAARGLTTWLDQQRDVRADNARLRQENQRLREWYDTKQAMEDKLRRYEELLNLNPEPGQDRFFARVVQDTRGPFGHRRLLHAGARHGVARYQAVMGDRGLIGVVGQVGRRTARVIMLTDPSSAIPVMVERTDARAILDGDQMDSPQLVFSRQRLGLREGDRIVTSGDAGLLPRGLAVGVAYRDDGDWRVRLYADLTAVDYVQVVRFAYPPAPEDEPVDAGPERRDGEGVDDSALAANAVGGGP